jgi:high-affinity K+ transport system ATPase subunit B
MSLFTFTVKNELTPFCVILPFVLMLCESTIFSKQHVKQLNPGNQCQLALIWFNYLIFFFSMTQAVKISKLLFRVKR